MSEPAPPTSREQLQARIERVYGPLSEAWSALLELDPEFAAAFAGYAEAPQARGALPPHMRELMLLALACSTTTLDERATELHVERALELGATAREVLDVLELVSLLGIHSLTTGYPLLAGRVGADEADSPDEDELAERARLWRDSIGDRGYWASFERHFPGFHQDMLRRDPELFRAYMALAGALWRADGLEPRWRELVFVIADLSTTHLFDAGAALHIENALHYGAEPAHVIETISLSVTLGARTLEIGVPALVRALARRGQAPPGGGAS